ncbi:MAG TPA: hypothetical protein VK308_11195 [Pyrinomonadaceae bacterium]|nr:hypothetical protein [Pyrinomonadaceae bacterium]
MKIKLLILSILTTLTLAIGAAAQNAKIESVYTSLETKDCKTIAQSNEGSGSYIGECKGVGGYKLQVTEGDIRQSINVIAPDKKKYELDFTGHISSGFSSVGTKAEWRVMRKGKIVTPVALIVRFNVSENPEDSSINTSYLVVNKITKNQICITDVIKPSAKANEEARNLADSSAGKACKTSDN